MDPLLSENVDTSTPLPGLIVKLSDRKHIPKSLKIISDFGEVCTCRVLSNQVNKTRDNGSVISLKAPRLVEFDEFIDLDSEGLPVTLLESDIRKAYTDFSGETVILGIIDWGFDFAHPNFIKDDGSTRLLALWDQTVKESNIENKYGYGNFFFQEKIDEALKEDDPYSALGYHPAKGDPLNNGAHGTHVADIAAGNGRLEGSPIGIAPNADIIFVHLSAGNLDGISNLGDSVRILEAIDFIRETAADTPWVINLSMGRHGGPHDGLTLVEQAMDSVLQEAPGRMIVQSTGNYYDAKTHFSGRVNPNESSSFEWITSKADRTPNELEIWYSGEDEFKIALHIPSHENEIEAQLGSIKPIEFDGEIVGKLYHRKDDPTNHKNHIDVFLYTNAPAGKWKISLYGEDVNSGKFHAWVERDAGCFQCQSYFPKETAVQTTTTGTICNGFNSIVVGAYNPHSEQKELAFFSSSGPTVDGRSKPDIVCPGVNILAARSSPGNSIFPEPGLTRKSGTSMAAPHITGLIALELEKNRNLDYKQLKEIIFSKAASYDNASESHRIGNGYMSFSKTDAFSENQSESIFNSEVHEGNNMKPNPSVVEEESYENNEPDFEDTGTKNFILLSGGPGPFDDRDVEHDSSWANYVTPPLLLTDSSSKKENFKEKDEEVWWFVYKPAYIKRWEDDGKSSNRSRLKAVKDVQSKGFKSYVDLLEQRAKQRNWELRWLNSATHFWSKLRTFDDPISRVWYWGHARDDLWLSVKHDPVDGTAIAPDENEIIKISDISVHLKRRFQKGNISRVHRFIGCNTVDFAKHWAKTFKVWAEGIELKVGFESIHKTGGEPCLVRSAAVKFFSPDGLFEPAQNWRAKAQKCKDLGIAELVEEASSPLENDKPAEGMQTVLENADVIYDEDEFENQEINNESIIQNNSDFGDYEKGFKNDGYDETYDNKTVKENILESLNFDKIQNSKEFLNELLQKNKIAENLKPSIVNSINPTKVFNAFVYETPLKKYFSPFFEVIACPREKIDSELQQGDLLFKNIDGNITQLALLASDQQYHHEELGKVGSQPGYGNNAIYNKVIEADNYNPFLNNQLVRKIGDGSGRLLSDQLILRNISTDVSSLPPLNNTPLSKANSSPLLEQSTNLDIRFVVSSDSRLRVGPPGFAEVRPRQIIPRANLVEVVRASTSGGRPYVLVNDVLQTGVAGPPNQLGWTWESNLRSNDASSLDWQNLKRSIVGIANCEYHAWNVPTRLSETNSATFYRQRLYWGIIDMDDVSDADLGSVDWQDGPIGADGIRRNGHYWSAVFISWVVQQAGAGEHFFYDSAHSCFIHWAKLNREAAYLNNPFWAYSINAPQSAWPEPGDILCKNRSNNNYTLDTISCGDESHTDIVVKLDRPNNRVITVGGNVGDRVARRIVTINQQGYVDINATWQIEGTNSTGSQDQFFALIRVRTDRTVRFPPLWIRQIGMPQVMDSSKENLIKNQTRFVIKNSVGRNGVNNSEDVVKLKKRLIELGFDWLTPNRKIDADTVRTIKLFQSIKNGRNTVGGDGRVDVPGDTFSWLQAVNAPQWQIMPQGSRSQGFYNYELQDISDKHDYGTNWMADTIKTAGKDYYDKYLSLHKNAALITINDVSLPRGGDTPDHKGHETGIACDLRLPRTDGTAPGNTTYNHKLYDQSATRAMLISLQRQPLLKSILFNDPVLIAKGLCKYNKGHNDHIHFEISPPKRKSVVFLNPPEFNANKYCNSDSNHFEEQTNSNKPDAGRELGEVTPIWLPGISGFAQVPLVAAQSAIASHNWNDRGVAPLGYIKGMALVYARVYCKLKSADPIAIEMAKADTGDAQHDALTHYAQEFNAAGMDNQSSGVDTLRHLFVLLIGLGMRESSGQYCEGRDRTATNTTSETAEAGLFQSSYNLRTAHNLLPQLFTLYRGNISGFKEVFKEGVTCTNQDLQNFGSGDGLEYQRLSKASPAFAAEFTAIGLRNRGAGLVISQCHWGPIFRREAEIRPECDAMLLEVQRVVDCFNRCSLLY